MKISQEFRDAVPEEKVLQRQFAIEQMFERWKTKLDKENSGKPVGLAINSAVLNAHLYNYFYDIVRMKKFHGIERINESKKGAYMVKWLARAKAIYFTSDNVDGQTMSLLLRINELFAIRIGFMYAEISLKGVDASTINDLLYQLYFRQIDEGSLAMWFGLLKSSMRK